MRSYSIILISFLVCFNAYTQPLKLGDKIPEINFNLLNTSQASVNLHALKGKVIVLDFWATWCVPCVQSFPKLGEMQKKFGNDLQIIAVSDESPDRIARFIKNRPVDLWFASDTSSLIKQKFPYIALPHVVIIDKEGVVRAITRGDELTEDVIAQVQKGIPPAVSFKNETFIDGEVFEKLSPGEEYFGIKGYQEGIRTSKMQYQNSISYINTPYQRLYLDLYKLNYRRIVYENMDPAEQKISKESSYSVMIATKENDYQKMVESLKQKLNEALVYKSKLGKKKDTVSVIRKIGEWDTSLVKQANSTVKSNSTKSKLYARSQPFGEAVANYLENFGVVDGIVLDETGDTSVVDINFDWEPESVMAIEGFLKKLGLKLEKAVREYDVLIIYK